MILPVSATWAQDGLCIAGCHVAALAEAHGTPLYLIDEATLEQSLATIRAALGQWPTTATVSYAAKAWLNRRLLRWLTAAGVGLDLVSEGELRYALQAGVDGALVHLHGNNKTPAFLRLALASAVDCVVIDHEAEIAPLERLAAAAGRRQAVWLRLNPAVAADSHAHITTAAATSKFGLSLDDGSAERAAARLSASTHLDWRGLHFHLGSQMRSVAPILRATERVLCWAASWTARGWRFAEFSPGAGWFVPYLPDEAPLPPADVVGGLIDCFEQAAWPAPWPRLVVEPGRELVARAGVALYTVGAIKRAGDRQYAFVDGGLADNPRPALYGARYHALLANRCSEAPPQPTMIAGPFCESGDVWAAPVALPPLRVGDMLAVPMSGAYQLSMASNYNGTPRPAVLWLREGAATVAQQRESFESLWQRDG
ncbi:MAG: diaminopimelate decarboxylase [Anaerolineales bacterium]|nr:diaminopimelate decarboxylase [Anaerolineales bacterium]MCB9127041.1 diaminopimelate decarboxylase [Ardenticatenales bacterium]MCB9172435.1 diaminopimelate decarboxylase [Ardenticatenales bacterium]